MTRGILAGADALLPRPRLNRMLAGRWKVAVLSAPAGYGKSTLASQYASGRKALSCRLHLEDRDTAHLLGTLLAAGMRARPPVGVLTQRLFVSRRDMERDGGLLTGSFLDELRPTRGERLVVLDDAHILNDAREASHWLARLIEESGPRVRFLLTCRGECPIPLARFDLQGGSILLRTGDLELTEAELAALCQLRSPIRLGREEKVRLRKVVGGWVAGLVLALHHIERTGRAPATPPPEEEEEGTQRLIAFLAEEVYAPLPHRLRRALCRAALLEDLDLDSIRVLLGAKEGDYLLEEIRRRDLFIRTLPDGAGAPRFHPLFRAYLRGQLAVQGSEGDRHRLVGKLARHWIRRGESGRAISALVEAGEIPGAVRLFDELARKSLRTPGGAVLGVLAEGILRAAPTVSSPWIRLHGAYRVRALGHYEEAATLVLEAEEGFLARRAFIPSARAYRLDAVTAILTGRLRSALERGREIGTLLPAGEALARGIVSSQMGNLLLHLGKPEEARKSIEGALRLLRKTHEKVEIADASVQLAGVLFTKGRWDDYVALGREPIAAYRRSGYAHRLTSLLINTAEAYTYLGQEEKAIACLDEVRALYPRTGFPSYLVSEAIGRARIRSEMGERAEAATLFKAAREVVQRWAPPSIGLSLDVWEGVFERRRGRIPQAVRLLNRAVEGYSRSEMPSWLNLARIERALGWGLGGRTAEALAELTQVARVSRRLGDRKELARIFLFEARVRQVAHDASAPALGRSLRELARERYFVLLRKEADVAIPLLNAAADTPMIRRARATLPDRLRSCFQDATGRPPRSRPDRVTIRLLGGFEVSREGRPVSFPRRGAANLIAFLALRRAAVTRESLAEAIWPGAPPGASRNRFDVTLSAARRALEPETGPRGAFAILLTDSGMCWLDPNRTVVDVETFEILATSCQSLVAHLASKPWRSRADLSVAEARRQSRKIDEAIASYGGDLLPQLSYASWTQTDRERLRDRFRQLLIARGAIALILGRPGDATEAARRVLASDPLDEEALRLLMRALAVRGEKGRILRTYRGFNRRMQRELATAPGPETTALLRDLIGRDASDALSLLQTSSSLA